MKELNSDNINERMRKMIEERNQQDIKFKLFKNYEPPVRNHITEKKLTSDEINERMSKMIEERNKQDIRFKN